MSIKHLSQVASPGTVIMSLASSPPPGYLKLEGQILNKSDYPDLYSKLEDTSRDTTDKYGVVHTFIGSSVDSTRFKLPDCRGLFNICGFKTYKLPSSFGGGKKVLWATGSIRGDTMRNITGVGNVRDDYMIAGGLTNVFYNWGAYGYDAKSNNGGGAGWVLSFDASKSVPTANEFRPVNIAVNYYIKY